MARGSVVWRCKICKRTTTKGACHPEGTYLIVYRYGGIQKWESVGPNKKDAERRLDEINVEITQGRYRTIKRIRFKDFAPLWLRDYAEGAVKISSLRSYRGFTRLYLLPEFGDYFLSQITPQQVQGFMAQCQKVHHLAPKTVNYFLMLLKQMLSHAKEWYYLAENPILKVKYVRVEPREMDYLRPAEIPLLLKHADEPFRTLFLTAILTGMRQGELLALQWGDIDWANNVMHVRRGLYWYKRSELVERGEQDGVTWRFAAPKTPKSIRTVALTPKLREALELHKLTVPVSPHDLVFCTRKGTPVNPFNLYHKEFIPALARAGLRRIRFHDLRHTYVALQIALNAPLKFIQEQLGHASIQITYDRYGHLITPLTSYGPQLDALVFGEQQESQADVRVGSSMVRAPGS